MNKKDEIFDLINLYSPCDTQGEIMADEMIVEISKLLEGFAIVPIEPTEEMIKAGDAASLIEGGVVDITDELPAIYKAIISP